MTSDADLHTRRRQVDRELHRLKAQFLFLFVFLLVALVIIAVNAQVQTNKVEYDRYDLCRNRQAEIVTYNARILPLGLPLFPVPDCGPDPRTD